MSEKHQKSRKLPSGYQDILKSIDGFFQQTYQQLQDYPLFNAPLHTRVYEQDDLFIIEAELPGVDKKQIYVDIYRQSVRIRVRQHDRLEVNDEKHQIVEKQESVQFRERIIPVPYSIVEKDLKATYRNGLLKITIPNKRRNIQID